MVAFGVILILIVIIKNGYGTIIGSKHDLSTTTTTQICVFCHTPHGTSDIAKPLWNRNISDITAFQMYSSPTIDSTIDPYPNPPSLACLSCHDGVSAEGDASAVNPYDTHNLRNGPGSGSVPDTTSYPNCNACHNTGSGIYPRKLWRIGANLMDDHPVSISYPNTQLGTLTLTLPQTLKKDGQT
ncbi:MAG: cytochrome c3 family protein [Persephonella sp.]|nr:cytochrome c3 family protein [Persephonella sp.]